MKIGTLLTEDNIDDLLDHLECDLGVLWIDGSKSATMLERVEMGSGVGEKWLVFYDDMIYIEDMPQMVQGLKIVEIEEFVNTISCHNDKNSEE